MVAFAGSASLARKQSPRGVCRIAFAGSAPLERNQKRYVEVVGLKGYGQEKVDKFWDTFFTHTTDQRYGKFPLTTSMEIIRHSSLFTFRVFTLLFFLVTGATQ